MKKLISVLISLILIVSVLPSCAERKVSGTPLPPSDWAAEYITKAENMGITRGFSAVKNPWARPIRREAFCHLLFNTLKDSGLIGTDKKTFSDTDDERILRLAASGFIEGVSDTEFDPDGLITREEAAVLLSRAAGKMTLAATEIYFILSDEDEISDWAENGVQHTLNLGFMKGVGESAFDPKGNLTAEQAICIMTRLYNSVPKNESFSDSLNALMPEDKNYVFSPFSIKTALLMAANGADKATLSELLSLLGVTSLPEENEHIKALTERYNKSDTLKINVSNSAWINTDRAKGNFLPSYSKVLSGTFGAKTASVTDADAVKKINGWVNDKTNGKIASITDSPEFLAMIINAVYFKGNWASPFSKNATSKDTFTDKNGKETKIDFMHDVGYYSYSEKDGVTVLSLPYKTDGDNISMYLIMADKPFSPEKVISSSELSSTYMRLSVPKFKVEYGGELSVLLKKLGVTAAFSDGADFSKMFTEPLLIDKVIHKAFINVDEDGTEAAAVTSISFGGASSMRPEPIDVSFSKPFTFAVRDNVTGEILFLGSFAFAG